MSVMTRNVCEINGDARGKLLPCYKYGFVIHISNAAFMFPRVYISSVGYNLWIVHYMFNLKAIARIIRHRLALAVIDAEHYFEMRYKSIIRIELFNNTAVNNFEIAKVSEDYQA